MINLGVLLLLALALCSYIAAKAARERRRYTRKIHTLLDQIEELKSELRRLRIAKRESEKNSSSLVSELTASLDNSQKALGELATLHQSQQDVFGQMQPILDTEDEGDTRKVRELKVQMASLMAQSQSSTKLVDRLKQDLVANRYRVQSLEEKLAKRDRESEQLKTLQLLEQRAKEENEALANMVEQQAKKLSDYLQMEKEVGDLRQQNRAMQSQARHQEQQLEQQAEWITRQAAEVDKQVSEQTSADTLPEAVQLQLQNAEDQLAQAVREKEFIEAQFLDVLASLEAASDLEAELERAKKEYALLEEHYLSLAETSGQAVDMKTLDDSYVRPEDREPDAEPKA